MTTRQTPPELAVIQKPEVENEQVQTINSLEDAISFVRPVLTKMLNIITELGIIPRSTFFPGLIALNKFFEGETDPKTLSELSEILYEIGQLASSLSGNRLAHYDSEFERLKKQLDESATIIKTIIRNNPYSQRVFQVVPDEE